MGHDMRFKYWKLTCVLVVALAADVARGEVSAASEPLLSAESLFAPDHLVDVQIDMPVAVRAIPQDTGGLVATRIKVID